MGSSDSITSSPLVSLALGQPVDLTELNAMECMQLLRGYIEQVQPINKFLPAKTAQEITSNVHRLSDKVENLPHDNVFWQPVKYQGLHRREKCVELDVTFGFINVQLRDAHAESHLPLYWTRGGELAVLIAYYSLEVSGTVAYDFVAISDEQLIIAFSLDDEEGIRLSRKMLSKIITSIQTICSTTVASREAEAQRLRILLDSATIVCNNLVVPQYQKKLTW